MNGLAVVALTAPDAGSARFDENHGTEGRWRLCVERHEDVVVHLPIADVCVVWARSDLHGGNGIHQGFQVIRHMVDLKTVNICEGAHDVHVLISGRAPTGFRMFFESPTGQERLRQNRRNRLKVLICSGRC